VETSGARGKKAFTTIEELWDILISSKSGIERKGESRRKKQRKQTKEQKLVINL